MKAIKQHFPVVLVIMLYKVALPFESVDQILKCDHLNENYWAVLSWGAVYCEFMMCTIVPTFECSWNLWKLLSSMFFWCIKDGSHFKKLVPLHWEVKYGVSMDKPISTMHQSQAQLFFVWFLVEYEGYSAGPSSLEQYVFHSLAIRTVMPLRKICATVSPFRGRVNLNIVHTSSAFESTEKKKRNLNNTVSNAWLVCNRPF